MYPNNFYYPYRMAMNFPYMSFNRPIINSIPNMVTRRGLFSRLGNSIGAIRGLNWSNIINNTSRTLGVINQAIPIVKQTGPMLHNMRSMLRVASVFRDETSSNKKTTKSNVVNSINKEDEAPKKEVTDEDSNLPNFFI